MRPAEPIFGDRGWHSWNGSGIIAYFYRLRVLPGYSTDSSRLGVAVGTFRISLINIGLGLAWGF